jgi:membrane protease YdiL (CAAX protease family)
MKILLRRIMRWQVRPVWWLVAVGALPTTTVVLAALFGDSVHIPSGGVIAREVVSIAIALILINLWEETAWAGFLQTRLERRHNIFVAAALTAVGFAAVHVPLRIINGEATTAHTVGTAFLSLLVLSLIFRSLIGMVVRGAVNSILLAATTHTFFNRSNNIDGIAADILQGSNRPIAALLAATLMAVVLGVCIRRKLRRSFREALDQAEEHLPAASRQAGGAVFRSNAQARPAASGGGVPPKKLSARELHRRAAGRPDSRSTAEQQRSKRAFSTDQNPT